ncbi:hypothetical protein [Bacillus bingmayongensis]|uniref:hypothetical protein n=1 Tax=Bacillus bingmayongensis TaxID=1150157 RepID=UPI0003063DF4|nr:hypothetical protein [Bacillus bingmayongensis]
MKRILIMLFFSFLMVIGCQKNTEITTSKNKLNDDKLVLEDKELSEKVKPKVYKPVSLKEAKKVLPFDPKLSSNLLDGYEPIKNVYIEDWGNKEKIAMETKIIPNELNKEKLGVYSVRVANFPDYPSDIINKKEYESELKLKSGVTAYYGKNQLAWKDKEVEYLIGYIPISNSEVEKTKDKLIEIANTIK